MEMDLQVGGEVALSVESEMKDVGLNVLICSVAWETPEGRRTFQRFLKFNVSINSCSTSKQHREDS
jgi:hypothetical protein